MTRNPGKKEGVGNNTVRCAVYTRKSTEEGLEQEFNTLDAQRESAEAYVASQKGEGWVCLPEHYDDGGFTGGNMDRPALQRLMADIQAGNIDCVVVYKVDRLSRSLLDFARIMEVFDKRKVAFVSVTQQFNTSTPMGRLVLNVLLSFAQFEREIIGERIRDKIAAQRRKGKWAGGAPVLGYDVDRSNCSPKLVINTEEATRVRKIFNLYLKLGSLLPVVKELAERGWCSKTRQTKTNRHRVGRAFDKSSLYQLLTNPIYIGKIKHKSDLYDGEHEAIVSPEIFRQVQETLHHNGRTGGAAVRNRYGALLKGLLFCGGCGRAMVHTFTGQGRKQYRYYTCTQAIKSGRDNCPSGSLPAAQIEKVVVEQVRCIPHDPHLRAEVVQEAQAHVERELAELQTNRRDLARELARHHAEIKRLAVEGPATSATTARIADMHEQVAKAETRLAELTEQARTLEGERMDEKDIVAAFADFDNVWNSLSPREQSQVLALLIARVEFNVGDSSIAMTFHPSAIKSLMQRRSEEAA
jgi:site-specific DNA recombinase